MVFRRRLQCVERLGIQIPPQIGQAEIQRVVLLLRRTMESRQKTPLSEIGLAQRVVDLSPQVFAGQLLLFG